jgi:hypothetical protein
VMSWNRAAVFATARQAERVDIRVHGCCPRFRSATPAERAGQPL